MSNLNPMAVVAAIITSLATTFAIQRNASALRIGA